MEQDTKMHWVESTNFLKCYRIWHIHLPMDLKGLYPLSCTLIIYIVLNRISDSHHFYPCLDLRSPWQCPWKLLSSWFWYT